MAARNSPRPDFGAQGGEVCGLGAAVWLLCDFSAAELGKPRYLRIHEEARSAVSSAVREGICIDWLQPAELHAANSSRRRRPLRTMGGNGQSRMRDQFDEFAGFVEFVMQTY